LNDARSELDQLKEYFSVLNGRIEKESGRQELMEWLTDVFTDKVYSCYVNLKNILKQIPSSDTSYVEYYSDQLSNALLQLAQSNWNTLEVKQHYLPKIAEVLNSLIKDVEKNFVSSRKAMYEQGWKGLLDIKPVTQFDTSRKKYVNARESLSKARESLSGKVEDVPIHLRSSIDLSIKERFRFSKLHPMSAFLKDADKFDFPLPSYDLIYELFDEGSARLHAGKGPTVFEAKQMIRIVSDFIDSLETITISQEKIDEFKSKCNAVD